MTFSMLQFSGRKVSEHEHIKDVNTVSIEQITGIWSCYKTYSLWKKSSSLFDTQQLICKNIFESNTRHTQKGFFWTFKSYFTYIGDDLMKK